MTVLRLAHQLPQHELPRDRLQPPPGADRVGEDAADQQAVRRPGTPARPVTLALLGGGPSNIFRLSAYEIERFFG